MITDINIEQLLQTKICQIEHILASYPKRDLSLMGGAAGIAIFYANLFRLTKDIDHKNKCEYFTEYTIRGLSRRELHHSYCNGFTGIGWALNHLAKQNIISISDLKIDFLEELDTYIYSKGKSDLDRKKYDFLHGPIGAVHYALERTHKEDAVDFIKYFVGKISDMKEEDELGFKWEDEIFPNVKSKLPAARFYNLGLAHGMPSIIETLRKIYSKSILPLETSELIDGAIKWILNHKLSPEDRSVFPSCVIGPEANSNFEPSRLSWCYGDLPLALILNYSGKTFNNSNWNRDSVNIMEKSIGRLDPLQNKYLDTCFCHGTSGIAHLFYKFHEITKEQRFQETGDFWLRKTIELANRQTGLAGFRMYSQVETNSLIYHRWKNNYGILEGISGIGLVMISRLSGNNDWDSCLLLS